jgi:hypothetical protein
MILAFRSGPTDLPKGEFFSALALIGIIAGLLSHVAGLIVSLPFVAVFKRKGFLQSPNKWFIGPLDRYKNYVPPQALRIALAIKKELPEVKFKVEYFAVSDQCEPVDPFLMAYVDDNKHYIAVRDEEGFRE